MTLDAAGGPGPDRELRRTFWVLVGVFNLALLAMAVGVMLVVFEGRLVVGTGLAAVGLAAFGLGWRGFQVARRNA